MVCAHNEFCAVKCWQSN